MDKHPKFVDYKKLDVIEILKKDLEWVPTLPNMENPSTPSFRIYTPHQVWS